MELEMRLVTDAEINYEMDLDGLVREKLMEMRDKGYVCVGIGALDVESSYLASKIRFVNQELGLFRKIDLTVANHHEVMIRVVEA